jgi:PPOX class probable F420-dependent enzyme
MPATTIPESHRPLLDTSVATLATIGSDERPQQTVVWFLAEGDTIRISLNSSRKKVDNLRQHPAVGILIIDPADSMRYLEVRGDASIEDDPDYEFAAKVGEKYGVDVRNFDAPGDTRVVVTIDPTRVHAIDLGG